MTDELKADTAIMRAECRGPECHNCGSHACTVEIQFPVRPDAWLPYCDDCNREMQQTADEVNQHEMDRFGGAYGVVQWLVRPLHLELKAAT